MKALSSLISLSVVAGALMGTSAPAISSTIGDLKVSSYIGQPFRGTLTGSKGLSGTCLFVVNDEKAEAGLDQLADVKVVKGKKAGQLDLVGWKPVVSPVLLVTLKNDCDNGTIYKSYQIFMEPNFDKKNAASLSITK